MQKSLLIFDLDGTLIDSVPDLTQAVGRMLAYFGKTAASESAVRKWVGNGSLALVQRALAWAELTDELTKQAHEVFLGAYADCACSDTVLYDGVADGLKILQNQGFNLAICTNKPMAFVPTILQTLGLAERFLVVMGGDSLPTKKPNPEPLLHICQTLGMPVSQAVMIGDSKNDVLAGKNAGMDTLALSYGYNYAEPITNSDPTAVFDSFGELVCFVGEHYV